MSKKNHNEFASAIIGQKFFHIQRVRLRKRNIDIPWRRIYGGKLAVNTFLGFKPFFFSKHRFSLFAVCPRVNCNAYGLQPRMTIVLFYDVCGIFHARARAFPSSSSFRDYPRESWKRGWGKVPSQLFSKWRTSRKILQL